MRIILSGGGTMGSVSPLIAIFEEIKKQHPDVEFLWLATKDGPEEKLISQYQIPIKKISSGKLRRYFSFKNFLDPLLVIFGFFQSLIIIFKFKPDFILTAGGFVAVPVVWAGWLSRRPSLIHQQDAVPGLANKLMARFAKVITVTFEKSLKDFPQEKTALVGNPVRQEILQGDKEDGYKFFKFDRSLPVVLIIGGGTGAIKLNKLVLESLDDLTRFCQIIHLTGGKGDKDVGHSRYQSFDFLIGELKNAYALADLVVSRAGMAVLTELAALRKPSIIIPMPGTHQEKNAMEFFRNNACAMLSQEGLAGREFSQAIKDLLFDKNELENLSRNMAKVMPIDAAAKIAGML